MFFWSFIPLLAAIFFINSLGFGAETVYKKNISAAYQGKAAVGKVDVDATQEFAAKYGVRNIPTVLIFQNREVVGRQVGVAPKKTYSDAIDALWQSLE